MPAEATAVSGKSSLDEFRCGVRRRRRRSASPAPGAPPRRGARVVVLERAEPPAGATNVAAGMLAPVGELTFGERELLEMTLASGALWADFAAEVEAASGEATGYERRGALHVALDRDEAGELRRRHDLQRELGLEAEWLTPRRCRELEPGLTPTFAGGVLAPSEASVDPRRLALALAAALREAGGELRTGTEVVDGSVGRRAPRRRPHRRPTPTWRPAPPRRPVTIPFVTLWVTKGMGLTSTATRSCSATGRGRDGRAWLPEEARPPVRPVKGEVVELRAARGRAAAGRADRRLRAHLPGAARPTAG